MAHYKGDANEATRAMHIMRKRERAKEELEEKKKKITGDVKVSTIDNKFAAQTDSVESQLRSSTVGLVTLTQMREKQEIAAREREKQLARKEIDDSLRVNRDSAEGKVAKSSVQKKTLSFYDDDEEDDDDDNEDGDKSKYEHKLNADRDTESQEQTCNDKCDIKNQPTEVSEDDDCSNLSSSSSTKRKKAKFAWDKLDVDTSLLPDREREEEERRLREKLATEWRERQQKLKEEVIEITFSYWDGSGHRRMVRMKKGDTIYQFLQACLETLRKDFNELRSVSADQLVYVKEDLIIPHHYTFYDFIVTKARGKSGPLFAFDVHEDVRLVANAAVEKDESHAGKVLLRSWYERNKHIFPASRWEPYDPTRSYDKYTISDKRSK